MILTERWRITAREEAAALFPAAGPLLPVIEACIDSHR
jgi:hypothetical protein